MAVNDIKLDISRYIFPIKANEIFNNNKKTALEVGFGEGEFLVELASKNNDWNFIGIEIKQHRFKLACKLADKYSLSNTKLLHIEAEIALRQVFDKNMFHTVYINFPDPWPKRRHSKHRLFNQEFINQLSKVLVLGGKVKVKTDHPDYITQIIDEFNKSDNFADVFSKQGYIIDENDTKTRFETEFRQLGKEIYSASFTNLSN